MRVITLNAAGGLNSGRRLASLLLWLQNLAIDVCFLQEVYGMAPPQEALNDVPGTALTLGSVFDWYHSPGSPIARGCATLVRKTAGFTSVAQYADGADGRILRLDACLGWNVLSLINVYAPAQPSERPDFFQAVLSTCLPSPDVPLLIAGDFNCILDVARDAYYPSGSPPTNNSRLSGAVQLRDICIARNLRDVWREAHPSDAGALAATHFSAAHSSGARLDRLYASPSLLALGHVRDADIVPSTPSPSDHFPISAAFNICTSALPRGTPVSQFPTALLGVPDFVDVLRTFLDTRLPLLLSISDAEDLVTAWIHLKHDIRHLASTSAQARRKAVNRKIREADIAATVARMAIAAAGDITPAHALVHIASLQAAARTATEAWQDLAAASLSSLSALAHIQEDTGSRFFHATARPPPAPTLIAQLNRPGRGPNAPLDTANLHQPDQVGKALDHCVRYFSSDSPVGLFRDRQPDSAAQAAILATLPRRLTGSAVLEGEGPDGTGLVTPDEMGWAISRARKGSAPGCDGLPYEFYAVFAGMLTPVLCRLFNWGFLAADESAPFARLLGGTICLLHKAGKPANELDGYRPLTLLNTDIKLMMYILAGRLQRPLEYLIDITQSAFLSGRDISDNVRYAQGLAARVRELGLPAWLLQSDLHKAYDSVDRGFLVRTMQAMGFRTHGAVRWAQILLYGSTARVRINRWFSPAFPVRSSLAQGSAVSCVEWVIVLQPLVSYLNSISIKRAMLPSGAPAPVITSFADDSTSLVLGDANDPSTADSDAAATREAFQTFAAAGGPEQSLPKSSLIPINAPSPLPPTLDPGVNSHAPSGYRLASALVPTRHLGVPIAAPLAACRAAAFLAAPAKIRAAAAQWAPVRPNAIGRSHIAISALSSKYVYASAFHNPPRATLDSMQRCINQFVAGSDLPEEATPFPGRLFPKAAVSVLPHSQGGLAVPNLRHAFTAMQAKLIWALFGAHSAHPVWDLLTHELSLACTSPLVPPGPAWIVAQPHAGRLSDIPTESYRLAAEAFLELGIHRIRPLEEQTFHSVCTEFTFGNAASGCIDASELSAAEACSLTRLREVWTVLHDSRSPPHLRTAAQWIVERLPAPWKAAMECAQPTEQEWHVVSPAGCVDIVLLGPHPDSESSGEPLPPCLWDLLPTGRLRRREEPYQATGDGRPALVVKTLKPQHAFNAAEWSRMRLVGDAPEPPTDFFLVGEWSALPVDPSVWGLGTSSLLDLSVSRARACLQAKAASSGPSQVLGYRAEGAAYPPTWPRIPPDPGPAIAQPSGLAQIEARWLASAQHADSDQGVDGQPDGDAFVDATPPWLRLRADSELSQGAGERAARVGRRAAGDPPPQPLATPQGDLMPGFKAAWQRLVDPTIHRPFRHTAWRIMHACIGVQGFLFHVRRTGSPFCSQHTCASSACVEDITHAFMTCPTSAPAIDWLISAWEALTGLVAPRTADFILLGIPSAGWLGCGEDGWVLQQWTRLRVATLGAIWRVRCEAACGRRDPAGLARQAVRMATQMLVDAIQRDWARAAGNATSLTTDELTAAWWHGSDISTSVARFARSWARGTAPVFCAFSDDRREIVMRLGRDLPVPAPV